MRRGSGITGYPSGSPHQQLLLNNDQPPQGDGAQKYRLNGVTYDLIPEGASRRGQATKNVKRSEAVDMIVRFLSEGTLVFFVVLSWIASSVLIDFVPLITPLIYLLRPAIVGATHGALSMYFYKSGVGFLDPFAVIIEYIFSLGRRLFNRSTRHDITFLTSTGLIAMQAAGAFLAGLFAYYFFSVVATTFGTQPAVIAPFANSHAFVSEMLMAAIRIYATVRCVTYRSPLALMSSGGGVATAFYMFTQQFVTGAPLTIWIYFVTNTISSNWSSFWVYIVWPHVAGAAIVAFISIFNYWFYSMRRNRPDAKMPARPL